MLLVVVVVEVEPLEVGALVGAAEVVVSPNKLAGITPSNTRVSIMTHELGLLLSLTTQKLKTMIYLPQKTYHYLVVDSKLEQRSR